MNSKPKGLSETWGFERMAERSSLTFTDMAFWIRGTQLDALFRLIQEKAEWQLYWKVFESWILVV